MTHLRSVAACGVVVAAALALSSCAAGASSSAPSPSDSTVVNADPAASKLVPSAIKDKGTIVVATSGTVAPAEFVQDGSDKLVGYDVELLQAVGDVLGLKVQFNNVPFDGIIPGIQAGRYDAAISTFAVTPAREKIVDMVSYAQAGGEFLVSADSNDFPKTLDDLCGVTVSVLQGSTDLNQVEQTSSKCRAAGKAAVDIKVFPDQNASVLAVASGQTKAMVYNSVAAGYTAQQSGGKLKATGATYNPALLGIALPKSPGLADAFAAAVKVLQQHGDYEKILKKWNSDAAALDSTKVTVNPSVGE